MKKISLYGIVLACSLLLGACGAGVKEPNSSVADVSSVTSVSETGQNVDAEVNVPELSETSEGKAILFAQGFSKVYYNLGDGFTMSDIADFNGYAVGYSDKYIVFDQVYDGEHNIMLFDVTTQDFITICTVNSYTYIDVYEDILTIVCHDYENQHYNELAYDLNTLSECASPNQDYYDEIVGYDILSYRYNATESHMSAKRFMDTCGYIPLTNGENVYFYDGNTINCITESGWYTSLWASNRNVMIFSGLFGNEYKPGVLYSYDIKGDGFQQIASDFSRTLAVKDDVFYFTTSDGFDDCITSNLINAYDMNNQGFTVVSEFNRVPGTAVDNPGVLGFTVTDDYIYAVSGDELGDTVWHVFPAGAGDFAEPSPTAMVLRKNPYADLGSVYAETYAGVCDSCGKTVQKLYYEVFAFDDSVSEYADSINAELDRFAIEAIGQDIESYSQDFEGAACEDIHGDFVYYVSSQTEISNIDRFSDNLVQISSSGYWYGGGAHGYPLYNHTLIDLSTGEFISLKDLFTGTNEELKDIVATRTVEDAIEYGDLTPYYSTDTDVIYSDAYTFTDIDTISGYFTFDGYVVEYAPYVMGPYAAGIIEVLIPYEDLGITLLTN